LNSQLVLAISLGILGTLALNIGKCIQKWKVDILKKGKKVIHPENRSDFLVWGVGTLLTTIAGPIIQLALTKTDQPSLITSLGGVGLIGVLIFSRIVLKEIINKKMIMGALLIIAGTIVMAVFNDNESAAQVFNPDKMGTMLIVMASFFGLLTLLFFKFRKLRGFLFAICSGFMLGMAMVLADVATVVSNNDMFAQFAHPYVYFAIMGGNIAFVATQFSLLRTKASLAIPTIHSVVILSSILLEYLLFTTSLKAFQFGGVGIIIFGVLLLTSSGEQITQDRRVA